MCNIIDVLSCVPLISFTPPCSTTSEKLRLQILLQMPCEEILKVWYYCKDVPGYYLCHQCDCNAVTITAELLLI